MISKYMSPGVDDPIRQRLGTWGVCNRATHICLVTVHLLDEYKTPNLPDHHVKDLIKLVTKQAKDAGMDSLPVFER